MIGGMARRKRWLISGTVIVLAVTAGAFTLLRRSGRRQAAVATNNVAPAVFTGSQTIIQGTVQPQQVVPVEAPVDGIVEGFLVNPGDAVYEGQVLAQIRNASLESQRDAAATSLERAKSQVNIMDSTLIAARLEASRARAEASRSRGQCDKAEKVYLRQQTLLNAGATPRLVFEKAEKEYQLFKDEYESLNEVAQQAEERASVLTRQLDAARKELADRTDEMEQARQDLSAGEVRSPVDGVVMSRRADVGQEVTREVKDLFVIAVNLAALQVALEPEPPVLARIRPGQDALVQLAEIPGQGIPGKVKEVKGTQVIVEFTSPSPDVRPGLIAQVLIKLT
jgi:HlyD family secretion protein